MRNHTKRNKIHAALELLNDAAHEKQEEVYEVLGDKYEHLKEIFEQGAENGQEFAGYAKKRMVKGLHQEEKKLKETAAHWNEKIHHDPWVYLGSVALGSLVIGLILGHKK